MDVYDKLKSVLRNEGWVEQKGGEGYMNGSVGTNFGKDGEAIHIGYDTMIDDDEWEELFGEA